MSSVIQTPVQPSARAVSGAKERPVFNPRLALGTMVGITLLMAAYRIYQQIFAWSAGLDSTDPAFETYWMNLLKGELVLLVCSWVGLWSWLWVTRDRNLAALKPRDEIRRYFNLVLYILVYAFCVYFTGSFFAEMDASWHQTVVRDTAFTPSHVILFYGTIPLYILFGVGAFLYSVTRLPRFAERLSIPFTLAVAGPFLILPNLGYNEWGHAFWMMEEFFSAPLHWGFVVLGWSVLALGGLLLQIAQHIFETMGRLEQEAA
jgi:methane/ammonia monooxygenase subunit C